MSSLSLAFISIILSAVSLNWSPAYKCAYSGHCRKMRRGQLYRFQCARQHVLKVNDGYCARAHKLHAALPCTRFPPRNKHSRNFLRCEFHASTFYKPHRHYSATLRSIQTFWDILKKCAAKTHARILVELPFNWSS